MKTGECSMLGVRGGIGSKYLLSVIAMLMSAMWTGVHAQSVTADVASERVRAVEAQAELIRELSGMGVLDQTIRTTFLDLRRDASDADRAIMDREAGAVIDRIDKAHEARLRELLKQREGWFPISAVGRRAAEAAYQIVQHSDDQAFKKDALERMKPLLGTGEIVDSLYAQMLDRYELGEGRLQIYGTQGTTCNGERHALPADVAEPETLNARRTAVGLKSMDEYLGELDTMYGRCTPRP